MKRKDAQCIPSKIYLCSFRPKPLSSATFLFPAVIGFLRIACHRNQIDAISISRLVRKIVAQMSTCWNIIMKRKWFFEYNVNHSNRRKTKPNQRKCMVYKIEGIVPSTDTVSPFCNTRTLSQSTSASRKEGHP